MFSGFSAEQLQWLSTENITYNSHRRGITLHAFESRPELNQFYNVLATSQDRNGTEFVSAMEGEDGGLSLRAIFKNSFSLWLSLAKDYPFYGTQWHPEKSAFEWDEREAICHSEHAIATMQMAANFFISEGDQGKVSHVLCVH